MGFSQKRRFCITDSSETFLVEFSPTKATRAKEVKENETVENKVKEDNTEKQEKSPKKFDRAKERPAPDRQLPEFVQKLANDETSESGEYLIFFFYQLLINFL